MKDRKMKYNPAFLTDDELVDSFVARHTELDLIIQTVKENITDSNQHILLIGPRGSGKTTLVLRVVIEIRRDKDLNEKWYPLVFSEESYPVSSPGEFWLEALFHLWHQTQDDQWKKTYEELREEKDETRLRERALANLLDFSDKIEKRVILVVENLNMLLGNQLTDDEAWNLRHTLLNEKRIMLLATATKRFEQIESSNKAMFDLFKIHDLKPLDETESRQIWHSITGQETTEEQIKPIWILTGGNPRLLNIISSFGARMSFKELMDDLLHLIDEHTEYFKSFLDGLASKERKVFVGLLEIWDPATAQEVATLSRLGVSYVSSLLSRLSDRGVVGVVREKGKRKYYQISERMYNIYYLMRRHGVSYQRIDAVVKFIITFYKPKNFHEKAESIVAEATPVDQQLRKELDSILSITGKKEEALENTIKYLEDQESIKKNTEPLISLFIELAANGYASEALEILQKSSVATLVEPLIIGLRIDLGEIDINVAQEIYIVGTDVAQKIKERRFALTKIN